MKREKARSALTVRIFSCAFLTSISLPLTFLSYIYHTKTEGETIATRSASFARTQPKGTVDFHCLGGKTTDNFASGCHPEKAAASYPHSPVRISVRVPYTYWIISCAAIPTKEFPCFLKFSFWANIKISKPSQDNDEPLYRKMDLHKLKKKNCKKVRQ